MAKSYIEREALRDRLYEEDAITMAGVAILNTFPTADVVEVVRCRDCRHYSAYDRQCNHVDGLFLSKGQDDAYCSCGERR